MAYKRKAFDYDGESDERQVSKKGLYDFISEGEPKTQPDDNIYNEKAQKMMAKMGYKEGKGLGKREQGITAPIEASKQKGKRGLGLNVKKGLEGSSVTWNYDMEEIGVCEHLEWFQNEKELFEVLKGNDINSWLREGPVKLTIDDETTFCDEETLHNVLSCKAIFDEVDPEDMRRARTCSNPFETIKSAFFQNRAAMKMANMDAVFNFIFTSPQESTKDRNVPLYEKDELFSFADVCAGPGGFSEYVLWRKNGMCKGFGFTLKGPNDFKLDDFKAGPAEMFETHYGIGGQDGDGDVFSEENQLEFKSFVMKHTDGRGVHLVMADGGFSVDGQENIQEILSHRLYLCQFLVALSILKEGGNFVCKLFDLFTPFSVGLVYLLSFCFEKITLFKPVTSRPANSERYIICHRKISSEDSIIVENYFRSVNSRMSQIHPGRKNSDKAISEVVPAEILVEDEHFFKYVKHSNERLGYLQSVSLMKIKTFVQNPTLYEERQSEIRKDYLEKWKIPDIQRKDSDYRENAEQRFKRLIEPQRIHYEPAVLDDRTLTTIKTKKDYIVMPITTKERHIMIGCGRHNVFARLINKQGGSWIRQEKVELPKDTILDVEIVEEQRGEGRVRKRQQTIHVNDVLIWFGQDLRSMSFIERREKVKPLLEALQKESRPDLTKFYLKQTCKMENLESEIFKDITFGLVKGGGQVPKRLIKIDSKENISRYLVPMGLCLFKTVNEPWMTAWSRGQNCQYFYNTRTREAVFEKPDEVFSTYHQSLESSILWFWNNELTEMKFLEYLNGLPQ